MKIPIRALLSVLLGLTACSPAFWHRLPAETQQVQGQRLISHPGITELVDRFLLPANLSANTTEELTVFLTHLRRVGLAFMQVYIAGQEEHRSYLQSSYVESLSVSPFNFSLIRSFPTEK